MRSACREGELQAYTHEQRQHLKAYKGIAGSSVEELRAAARQTAVELAKAVDRWRLRQHERADQDVYSLAELNVRF